MNPLQDGEGPWVTSERFGGGMIICVFRFLYKNKVSLPMDKVTENNIMLNDHSIITKISINSEISLRVGDIFLEITEPNSSKLF